MTKKVRLIKLEQYEDDTLKYVVLGDKETDGAEFAFASVIIKEEVKND